jgi:hypothetical protein
VPPGVYEATLNVLLLSGMQEKISFVSFPCKHLAASCLLLLLCMF